MRRGARRSKPADHHGHTPPWPEQPKQSNPTQFNSTRRPASNRQEATIPTPRTRKTPRKTSCGLGHWALVAALAGLACVRLPGLCRACDGCVLCGGVAGSCALKKQNGVLIWRWPCALPVFSSRALHSRNGLSSYRFQTCNALALEKETTAARTNRALRQHETPNRLTATWPSDDTCRRTPCGATCCWYVAGAQVWSRTCRGWVGQLCHGWQPGA